MKFRLPLFTLILLISSLVASAQTAGSSFVLTYEKDKSMISSTYESNSFELNRLNKKIVPVLDKIEEGDYHLLIVSHVPVDNETISLSDVNMATRRGNNVARYLKEKYDLEDEDISFYVDQSGRWGSCVHICLLNFPKPVLANSKIHFSNTQDTHSINAALAQYPSVPYLYMANEPEMCDGGEAFAYTLSNGDEIPYVYSGRSVVKSSVPAANVVPAQQASIIREAAIEVTPAVSTVAKPTASTAPAFTEKKSAVVTTPVATETKAADPVVVVVKKDDNDMPQPSPKVPTISESNRYSTFRFSNMRVKTNLLSWATVSPGITVDKEGAELKCGAMMPNIELEYMFADWGSVALGGVYSNTSYKGDSRNLWGVAALSLEPRLWFCEDGRHNGANVGLRLNYGNFNVRDNKPLGYGVSGQFFSASAMLNYSQNLPYGFFIEGGFGFGSRIAFNSSEYMKDYEDDISVTINKFESAKFMINFQLCIGYRFGKY